jgi:hypothetical protein
VSFRRIAALAGALAGLVLLVLVIVSRPAPRPPAEHFRVELERPALESALWFVDRYPEYFTSGEQGLGTWLDELEPREREFVVAMAQTLTWTWVEHELAKLEAGTVEELARAAIVVVRRKTLNQLELNLDHYGEVEGIEFSAYIGEPDFAAGVFARLVRGASNCEGQNHLLALLLDTALEPDVAWRPKIAAEMAGVPDGHELVRVFGLPLAQAIFVDAWSNLPAFAVDPSRPADAPLLTELGERPPPVVPGFAARAPYPAALYADSEGVAIELLPGREAPRKPLSLEVRAPPLDEASLAQIDDPWRLYLLARVLHLYDDPRAEALYRLVLEHHCDYLGRPRTFVCAAAALFLDRNPRSGDPHVQRLSRPGDRR